jgi:hypothetical protein
MSEIWPWLALVLLGVFHGLNPAMGWLFAVARGLQEQRSRAVIEALLPIGIGHAASVAAVVTLFGAIGLFSDSRFLRMAGGVILILFGGYRIFRSRSHPRWVGMRVSQLELAFWSFLMSTAHGAGLMLFPVMLSLQEGGAHSSHMVGPDQINTLAVVGIAAVLVHSVAMITAMGAIAVLVYEKLGLAVLHQAWVNLDIIWAFSFIVAGTMVLVT